MSETIVNSVRHISTEELARIGTGQVAYIKPVLRNGMTTFAIHGADGAPLAELDSAEAAVATIIGNHLLPQSIH